MNIQLTQEQVKAFNKGESITITPEIKPKQWEPEYMRYPPSEMKALRTYRRLAAYVREYGGGWQADWEDRRQSKYYVYYNYLTVAWCIHQSFSSTIGGTIYMSRECAVNLVVKLKTGEVVL